MHFIKFLFEGPKLVNLIRSILFFKPIQSDIRKIQIKESFTALHIGRVINWLAQKFDKAESVVNTKLDKVVVFLTDI